MADEHPQLDALFLNCTLKRSPRESNTDALIEVCRRLMEPQGVRVDALRPVDYVIADGMRGDMTELEEGAWERDDWPQLYQRVLENDIVVICTPIWLGEQSSVCSRLIQRLYANSAETNDKGQPIYYGRVGGCLVTGNEDGIKHCAQGVLFSLQALGFTIPPMAYSGWVGEAGPGPSYRDEESNATENDFTNRRVTTLAWNLIHLARMLKEHGGLPRYGNDIKAWEDGERFGLPDMDEIRQLKGGPSQKHSPAIARVR